MPHELPQQQQPDGLNQEQTPPTLLSALGGVSFINLLP